MGPRALKVSQSLELAMGGPPPTHPRNGSPHVQDADRYTVTVCQGQMQPEMSGQERTLPR